MINLKIVIIDLICYNFFEQIFEESKVKKIYINLLKSLLYIAFIMTTKFKKQKLNDYFSRKFLEINNDYVLKRIKKKLNGKILILLPHCIQLYDCEYKITSDINNCRVCGKCVVYNFVDIQNKYQNIEVKIATGGTLARKYVKEIRPSLIIAVACKRDLISGIKDAEPFLVYGVFNKIKNEPCINTTVVMDDIYKILDEINL